jgi:hypothetical protein
MYIDETVSSDHATIMAVRHPVQVDLEDLRSPLEGLVAARHDIRCF